MRWPSVLSILLFCVFVVVLFTTWNGVRLFRAKRLDTLRKGNEAGFLWRILYGSSHESVTLALIDSIEFNHAHRDPLIVDDFSSKIHERPYTDDPLVLSVPDGAANGRNIKYTDQQVARETEDWSPGVRYWAAGNVALNDIDSSNNKELCFGGGLRGILILGTSVPFIVFPCSGRARFSVAVSIVVTIKDDYEAKPWVLESHLYGGVGVGTLRFSSSNQYRIIVSTSDASPQRGWRGEIFVNVVSLLSIIPSHKMKFDVNTRIDTDMVWTAGIVVALEGGIVTVQSGSTLTILRGTLVLLAPKTRLVVKGKLVVLGTAARPVTFTSLSTHGDSSGWDAISVVGSGILSLTHAWITGGGKSEFVTHGNTKKLGQWETGGAIDIFNGGSLSMTWGGIVACPGKAISVTDGDTISLSDVVISQVSEGLHVVRTEVELYYCLIANIPSRLEALVLLVANADAIGEDNSNDAVFFDGESANSSSIKPSIIHGCRLARGCGDGIEHRGARLVVSNSWIEEFSDEGVVASGRREGAVVISDTVITGCRIGVRFGWGLQRVIVESCLIVGNEVGLLYPSEHAIGGWHIRESSSSIINTLAVSNSYENLEHSVPGFYDNYKTLISTLSERLSRYCFISSVDHPLMVELLRMVTNHGESVTSEALLPLLINVSMGTCAFDGELKCKRGTIGPSQCHLHSFRSNSMLNSISVTDLARLNGNRARNKFVQLMKTYPFTQMSDLENVRNVKNDVAKATETILEFKNRSVLLSFDLKERLELRNVEIERMWKMGKNVGILFKKSSDMSGLQMKASGKCIGGSSIMRNNWWWDQGWSETAAYHVGRLLGFRLPAVVVTRRIVLKEKEYSHFLNNGFKNVTFAHFWRVHSKNDRDFVRGSNPEDFVDIALVKWVSGLRIPSPPNQEWRDVFAHIEPMPTLENEVRDVLDIGDIIMFDYIVHNYDRYREKNWVRDVSDRFVSFDNGLGWWRTPKSDCEAFFRCPPIFYPRDSKVVEQGDNYCDTTCLPLTSGRRFCRFRRTTINSLRNVGPAQPDAQKRLDVLLRESLSWEEVQPIFPPEKYGHVDDYYTYTLIRLGKLLIFVNECIDEYGEEHVLFDKEN